MTTTDHRDEADRLLERARIMRVECTATEHLLAAIHDEQRRQTALLRTLVLDPEPALSSRHHHQGVLAEPEPEGRVGWLRWSDGSSTLVREVDGGWSRTDDPRPWRTPNETMAVFEPLSVYAERDDLAATIARVEEVLEDENVVVHRWIDGTHGVDVAVVRAALERAL